MESENRPQIKDGWAKLDDNYYRMLEFLIWKSRSLNLIVGLGVGILLGASYRFGLTVLWLYSWWISTNLMFFLPFVFALSIIVAVMLLTVLFCIRYRNGIDGDDD